MPLADAQRLYVARTYAYVADGKDGLAIIDVERPEHPHLYQMYTAEGRLNDVRACRSARSAQSMFALVADGKNGLRVLQMISPENVPEHAGFSPRPNPILDRHRPARGRGGHRGRARTGPRPRGGRNRRADGGVRPARLAALQPREMLPFLRHGTRRRPKDRRAPGRGIGWRT